MSSKWLISDNTLADVDVAKNKFESESKLRFFQTFGSTLRAFSLTYSLYGT